MLRKQRKRKIGMSVTRVYETWELPGMEMMWNVTS